MSVKEQLANAVKDLMRLVGTPSATRDIVMARAQAALDAAENEVADDTPLPPNASFCPNCAERNPVLHWADGYLYCSKCDPQG